MKYLKYAFIFSIIISMLFVSYLEFGGNFLLNKDEKRVITWEIRTSEKLPENFTNFYNTIYPKSLNNNSWDLISNVLLYKNSIRKECPCNQMSYHIYLPMNIKAKPALKHFMVTRYIEQHYNQKGCLNFNFSNFDFLENRKGISQVSKSLFNKNVKDLKPIEMAEILALYENPVKNNRFRNPERALSRATYFNNLYLKNSNQK